MLSEFEFIAFLDCASGSAMHVCVDTQLKMGTVNVRKKVLTNLWSWSLFYHEAISVALNSLAAHDTCS